jgi:nicotinate-nucleotide adenylyltransferase
MQRIGILGGTFDPVHLGHLIPAQYALEHLGLDRLLLVPSAAPVHRPRHVPASPEHRLRMCELAAADIPRFEASDIETRRTEPSFTVLTLEHFTRTMPAGTRLYLLVGEDNVPLLHTWRDIGRIAELAAISVLPRPCEGAADTAALESLLGPAAVSRQRHRDPPPRARGPTHRGPRPRLRGRVHRGAPAVCLNTRERRVAWSRTRSVSGGG